MERCATPRCANYGNARNEGRCNACASAGAGAAAFVRFNEGGLLGEARHEERERLREEAAIESSLLVEVFAEGEPPARARQLLTPHQALAAPARAQWRVAVLDVSGHFCVAAAGGAGELVVLNTTSANYLAGVGSRAAALAFDLLVDRA
jgi:hypothetical protein